ncbi:DUF2860 family protein [Desulfoluna sp.]|uniref:DUF2860 family protein n=1 Tax=Desulfoluna sp. TaxID=2045199 RepID=UPI00262E2342|nr:DUF2860 family protein [Desulfoluna sp.]
MKRHILKFVACSLFLIFIPPAVHAQRKKDSEPGFSGRLQGGAIFIQTDSQLSTDATNRQTDTLDGPADTHHISSGIASVYLRYQFENGTAVYAGNPLEVGEGFALEAGISRSMDAGTLDIALTSLPIGEVWKNPYQTVGPREKTDIDVYGLHVQWQEIAGSPWELEYKMAQIDIEDDGIGDLENDLERSGQTHELGIKYHLSPKGGFSLSPELSCTYGDINGRANSCQGMKLGALVKQVRPPWIFIGLVSGSHDQYKKKHPLFGKTRKESALTTFVQVMRLNLWGVERLFGSFGAGYVWTDANIDFYDSQTIMGLASVGINF